MAEENVGRLYSTQGVDWSDDDAIRSFAEQVYASFTAAVRESEQAQDRGEIREESGLSKYFRSLRDSRIAEAQLAAQQVQDEPEETQ
jgi:hypothetical protein